MLTPGSISRLFDIPGLAEYARGLKSIAQALYLRDHIIEQFEDNRIIRPASVYVGEHDRRWQPIAARP